MKQTNKKSRIQYKVQIISSINPQQYKIVIIKFTAT